MRIACRGGNQVASCLKNFMENRPPEVETLTLITMYFTVLKDHPSLVIKQKFLIPVCTVGV